MSKRDKSEEHRLRVISALSKIARGGLCPKGRRILVSQMPQPWGAIINDLSAADAKALMHQLQSGKPLTGANG